MSSLDASYFMQQICTLLEMSRRYDIIQTPRDIKQSDLPPKIEVRKPFKIRDAVYVLEESDAGSMKVCKKDGDTTSLPSPNKHFYVIRKLG
jgi:hypothetical protein